MDLLLLLGRLILATAFAIAGLAKLTDPAGSRKSIVDFGLPQFLSIPLARLLPLAELICAVALIPLASAWWGGAGVLILLLTFIAAISISLIRGRRPDCHCFGQLHSSPIGAATLVRNSVLAAIAAAIIAQGQNHPGATIMTLTDSPLAWLSTVVALLTAFVLWTLTHVLRQNGRLLLRLETLEQKIASGAFNNAPPPPPPGLAVNSKAPAFALSDLAGVVTTLEMLLQRNKLVMLLFSEPGCGACEASIPEFAQWQRDYRDQLLIVPISRGSVKENRAKGDRFDLRHVLLQTGREVSQAYLIEATPSAVLIKDGRIESPIAAGLDQLRGLVARATLPAPVKTGDPVPSLRFPDLTGKLIDLAQFQTRRTLMLFWSPSCGFCQQMLDDLKHWENNPREDAPELVVIAAGALDENRKQGFRSPVLLDPYYAASKVFNSGGTPSAVMVEQGRIASGVAVGAEAVLTLAGAR